MRAHRRISGLLLCVTAVILVAACGSSGSSSSGGGTSGNGGKSFTFGYSIPTGQNPWITDIANAAKATAGKDGGKMTLADAQLNPNATVSQVNRFITEGMNAIVIAPAQVPESLQGILAKARAKGIKTFALEWNFTNDTAAPPASPVQGQVIIDRGGLGRDVAKRVNADEGGHAKIMYVGLPFPVRSLDFFAASMRSALAGTGSKVVIQVNNPKDNAEGALGPETSGLTAHPDVNAIVTYNGPSAVAAVRAVKAAGLAGKVKIYNIQLDTATGKLIQSGAVQAAWDLQPVQLGDQLGKLIGAAGSGAPESQWAKTVVVRAPMYDRSNIGSWTDPDAG
jgi:ABC-type sugar transport system substrate-binding protein